VRALALLAAVAVALVAWTGEAAAAIPGFPPGQCTEWAYLKRPDIVDTAVAKSGIAGDWNAWRWATIARGAGLSVGTQPAVGAIAVFPQGVGGAGATGHVGYVEKVLPNGSYTLSEQNFNGSPLLHYRIVTPLAGVSFVYLQPGAPLPPANPKPSGQLLSFRTAGTYRASALDATQVQIQLNAAGTVRLHVTGVGLDKTLIVPLPAGATTVSLARVAGASSIPAGRYRVEAYALGGGLRLFWSNLTLAG
jgi:hypothetical protein